MNHGRTSATKSARQEDIVHVERNVEIMMLRGDIKSGSVVQKTAEMLGLSKHTVYKSPEEMGTPGKTRKRERVEGGGVIDEFTRALIRRTIYAMIGRGEHVKLNKMLEAVRQTEDPGFQGGRSALYRLLQTEGTFLAKDRWL
ncbi:hypothetical protein PR048_030501 [Dryococelus australis]|uniref:Transposase n=1 Tax=Dryococelus australis TaxID=614101 RepID=A0ABQ9G964_9NEOP|nr:hypothetical protein PR048_030501 [Dryococelus australis]